LLPHIKSANVRIMLDKIIESIRDRIRKYMNDLIKIPVLIPVPVRY
jgi:vacuolar-type H+-ATPase subunit F/Vma7